MTAIDAMIERRTISMRGDEDLRRYAATGDAQAFARLTQRHINLVYTFCRRELTDAHLAEDATQAVFILLAQKARTIRPDAVLASWLFQAARRCCSNARRANIRRTRHETEAAKLRPGTAVPNTTHSLEQEEAGRVLHRAMQRLGSDDRDVLLLRYFDEDSNRGVGEILGLSEEVAKTRVVRAVRKLRSILVAELGTGAAVGAFSTGATIVNWLGAHAVLHAPSGLAQASAAAATGAAGSGSAAAAAIAKAASSAIPWSKPVIVAALLTATAALLTGGVLLQINRAGPASAPASSAQVTLPQTPPAPTTTVVADPYDRSTPLACLKTVSRCFRETDLDGIDKCMYFRGGDEMAKVLKMGIKLDVQQIRIEKLMLELYGPNVNVFRFVSMTPDTVLDEVLKTIKPADVRITNDRAVVNLRLNQQMINNMGLPQMAELLAWPMYFVRDDATGAWQVDVTQSVALVAPDRDGMLFQVDAKSLVSFFEANLDAGDAVIKALEKRELLNEQQVADLFNGISNQEKAAKGVGELGETWTIPKAFATQFAK